jgi:hypothetical protein
VGGPSRSFLLGGHMHGKENLLTVNEFTAKRFFCDGRSAHDVDFILTSSFILQLSNDIGVIFYENAN